MNILNKKIFHFLHSTNFKVLKQMKGNSINNCDYFRVCCFCLGWPLLLLAVCIKNLVMSLVGANI